MFPAPFYSIKVQHPDGAKGPKAKELLTGPVRDFLFDLDVVHGADVSLAHYLERKPAPQASRPEGERLTFPALSYDAQSQALYWYAASAAQFPLLQFLAYYQILEFYFRSFTRESVARKIQILMRNPRFNSGNSKYIGQVIDLSGPAHLGVKGEKEQLESTIRGCVTPERLREILQMPSIENGVCGKSQKIAKLRPINIAAGEDDLFKTIANRIYDIRCRIVHTKESSESNELELLLPTDDEVKHLGPEIALVKCLAQEAVIYRAATREG